MKKWLLLLLALALLIAIPSCINAREESDISDLSFSEGSDISDQVSEEKTAVFYYPDNAAEGLIKVTSVFDGTIEGLIAGLAGLGGIAQGTTVISFEIDEDTAYIDLSERFCDSLIGSAIEYLTIASLVNTVIDYCGAESVMLTIEGECLDTGHNLYDCPMCYFDCSTGE